MKPTSFVPTEYWPTSPRSGNDGTRIFRMTNMILRGSLAHPYAEVYGGSLDLGEDIPTSNLTGTVALTEDSKVIVGTGTAFTTELHLGQFLLAHLPGFTNSVPLVVDEIIDDTHFTSHRAPTTTVSGWSVARLPVITEMSKKRFTLLRGNAVEFDLGSIIAVGDGTLRRNGVVLPGSSLVAAKAPKLALFDGASYSVFTLGMATPATLTAANGPAGTKNMQAGVYSVRAVPARIATKGYNNPSPKAEVTLTAGNVIRSTLPAADTANGQDAWMFFVTLFTSGGGINGPWYRYELPAIFVPVGSGVGEIPAAGGTYDIEYNDAEVVANDLLTFNNNPPPDAEFVAYMAGIPVYISCMGPNETSPGPMIASGKPRNLEAVPPTQYVSTSPPDTIVGFMTGVQGRLYLMCVNSLQIALATQATDPRIPAFAVRPFWKSGFPNPETLLSVGDNLIGMTTNGLARSISEGDEGSEEYNFATAVEELTRAMTPGHTLLKIDPKNNAVVLFHSGNGKNIEGYWTTRALMYSLRENKWVGDITLSSFTGDMIVSSAAIVNGQLEFLAGGRQEDLTTVMRTYRWDDPTSGEVVPYAICWQLTDDGEERRPKAVKSVRVVAKLTDAEFSIQGAAPGTDIDIGSIESLSSGMIQLPDSAVVHEYERIELDSDNWIQWAPKIVGVWNGSGERDRIDEIVVESLVRGTRG